MAKRREAAERPADDAPRSNRGVEKDRYKAEMGRQDLIVILCKPRWTPKHYTGKFYLQCLEEEDAPCCEYFGKAPASSTTYVIHVASRRGSGEWKIVGQPKVWGFGEDKWIQYQVLLRDNCKNDFKKLQKMLISVSCQNTDKQTLFLSAYPNDDVKLTQEMFVEAKERKEMFDDDIMLDRQDVLHTITSLTGGHGGGEPAQERDDDAPPPEQAAEPPNDELPIDESAVDQQIDDVIADWDP